MYIVVNHEIDDPAGFWTLARSATANLPAGFKVHQTLSSPDGRRAVCVWEAASVEAVRDFLDPATAGMARNEYFESVNSEGTSMPALARGAGA